MIEEVKDQIVELVGCERTHIIDASAKQGIGINAILQTVVEHIRSPEGDANQPLQAMIFDSVYNTYRGVEVYFRIFNGTIKAGDSIKCISTDVGYKVEEVGILNLRQLPLPYLQAGNVCYLVAAIKNANKIKVGDTITHMYKSVMSIGAALKGFEEVKPMVFAGIYPADSTEYEALRDSMEKLKLNDASLVWEPETSAALGFGFLCGFLVPYVPYGNYTGTFRKRV